MSHFAYTGFSQDIRFGDGELDRLGAAVEAHGWQRVLLCASGSARRNGGLERASQALGDRLADIYEDAQPHVPEEQVQTAAGLGARVAVDGVIGLGGGSPIGLAKAVAWALAKDGAQVRCGAIPTTYAGSEMTAVYGVTRLVDGRPRKVTVADPRIAPALVIYDPGLTLDLPPALTASTGINALAHCLEALYSTTRHPLSSAVAFEGLRLIASHLSACVEAGGDREARTGLLIGAHLAGASLASVTMGLHHGLCHVLGGSAGVPHGLANAIILPHALRFNADVVGPQLLAAASILGATDRDPTQAVLDAADRITALIGGLRLPQRLRDVGLSEPDLPVLAALAAQNRTVLNNPKPISSAAEIEALLHAAW